MRLELLAVIGNRCYIETGLDDSAKLKARTLENCQAFRKEHLEIRGTLDYFEALADGLGLDSFVRLPSGSAWPLTCFTESDKTAGMGGRMGEVADGLSMRCLQAGLPGMVQPLHWRTVAVRRA